MVLPYPADEPAFWQTMHGQPVAFWQGALDTIRERHGLPVGNWKRASAGKNLVFLLDHVVVKLCPPFWLEDITSEAKTARLLHGRLPVATPELLAEGELDGWYYLMLSRMPGELLRRAWKDFNAAQKAAFARQQGALMAALHALPTVDFPHLAFNWTDMLDWQIDHCYSGLQQAGVPQVLLDDLAGFLEATMPVIRAENEKVVLHGDLDAVNLLFEFRAGEPVLSALIDFGDAKIGSWTHELISPAVHTFLGDAASLRAWYEGYGFTPDRRTATLQAAIMARIVLYYAPEMLRYLPNVPGALACQRWQDVAECFLHFKSR